MIGPATMEAFTPFNKKKYYLIMFVFYLEFNCVVWYRRKTGWFAWAGVAVVGIVSSTIILASGHLMKESSDEKHHYNTIEQL